MIAGSFDPVGAARDGALLAAGPLALTWAGRSAAAWHSEPPEEGPGCVLEGRIANIAEIAGALGLPASDPPASLVARAYARLGERLLPRLRGDFAFVAWGLGGRDPVLVRDQLGGRALFVHRSARRVTFASELKDLLGLLARRPGPDRDGVIAWLAGAYPRTGHTLYRGLDSLPAAHLLELDESGRGPRPFWQPRYEEPLTLSEHELAELLHEALEAAVARALQPGGRPGVLLSGGLDSVTVAALATRGRPASDPLRAYSAVFPGRPSMDESGWIRRAGDDLGLATRTMAVGRPSMLRGALDFLAEWELPLFSQNDAFWQPLMHMAADDGVEVMLDGEGGDLLFGAAPALMADRVRRLRLADARKLAQAWLESADAASPARVRAALREQGLKGALPYGLHEALRRRRAARHAPSWLLPADVRRLAEREDPLAWKRGDGPLWWRWLADSLTAGLDALGARDHLRRRAAAAGLEARQPLLDLDLVELVLRLPPELAFDARFNRPLLRKAAGDLVPGAILARRDKSRFDQVFLDALAGRDLPAVRRLLGPQAAVYEYADRGKVTRELLDLPPSRHPRGHLYWLAAVWRLATAECWLQYQPGQTRGPFLGLDPAAIEVDAGPSGIDLRHGPRRSHGVRTAGHPRQG